VVAHVVRRTVMVVEVDVERLVLLFDALLRIGILGQVDGSSDGSDVLDVLLSVAVEATVDA
jgi:hypothetical protein